jgi:hypothetical protein
VLISICYFLLRRVLPLTICRWRSPDVKELEIAVLRHELTILRLWSAKSRSGENLGMN